MSEEASKTPPVTIRGLEKFSKPERDMAEDLGSSAASGSVEIRGLEKFKKQSPEAGDGSDLRLDLAEDAIDIKALSLTDQVLVQAPEGDYKLEFFGRGYFEVHGPDGKFVGDGKADSLAPGGQLEFTLSGRNYATGPISAIRHIPGVAKTP